MLRWNYHLQAISTQNLLAEVSGEFSVSGEALELETAKAEPALERTGLMSPRFSSLPEGQIPGYNLLTFYDLIFSYEILLFIGLCSCLFWARFTKIDPSKSMAEPRAWRFPRQKTWTRLKRPKIKLTVPNHLMTRMIDYYLDQSLWSMPFLFSSLRLPSWWELKKWKMLRCRSFQIKTEMRPIDCNRRIISSSWHAGQFSEKESK